MQFSDVGMNQYEKIDALNEAYRNSLSQPVFGKWHWVQLATRCIHNNLFKQKLTVGWMMKQCQITNHNLSGVFAFCHGKTPEQYILYHRIAAAKQLLQDETLADIRLTDIALGLGFHSLPAFDEAFKSR